jgi:hypothetical protein
VRRVLAVVALLGTAALVYTAVALATGTQQSFTAKFGSKKPGKATTLSVDLHSTDPTNTAHNNAPDPARKVVLAFPKGANFDSKAAPTCSATALDFQNKGTGACPAKTIVGTGSASANSTFSSVGEIAATVTAFNKTKGLYLYVQPAPGAPAQAFVITASITGSKKSGFKLTTTPPPNCLPPGSPPSCSSGEAPLDKLILNTKVKKSGKHVLLTTPTTCPKSKNWQLKATITFKTDGTKSDTAKSPCTK